MASFRLGVALCAVVLVSVGCDTPSGGNDAGGGGSGGQAPELSSVSPERGPVAGNTLVTVNGANFEAGATVTFGDRAGTGVTVLTKRKISVLSPPGNAAGAVAVTVANPDGQKASLLAAFTYETGGGTQLEESVVVNPLDGKDTSGSATPKVTIVGHVQVRGVTKGMGQGPGLKAQVGVAMTLSTPPAQTDFTWTDATYAGDVDGLVQGDLGRDAYQAEVMVPAATGSDAKVVRLAARFSLDDGASWTLADKDGSANGVQESQVPKLTISRPVIGWCKLGGENVDPPPDLGRKVGETGPTIFGQVYAEGITPGTGAGQGIVGQLGYGAPGSNPETWTWAAAMFNRESGGGQNDEFRAVLPVPAAGVYKFAYRFALASGPWKYCDADGLQVDDFTEAQAGTLRVTAPGVDQCALQFPATIDARTGRPSGLVYGRVYAMGITEAAGAGAGVSADLGVGPSGSLPDAGGWVWTAATYNVEASNGWEEWQAQLQGPDAGPFSYAYRFRHQAGAYLFCDLDGSGNGYSPAQAGSGTSKAADIDDCVLEGPNTLVTTPGGAVPAVSTLVKAVTVTDSAGQGANVTAQVGYGAVGSDPSMWTTWTAASYLNDETGGLDRYRQGFTAPGSNGSFDVTYRVRYGTGAWQYCDRDGSANGYRTNLVSQLTVASASIQGCNLQFVDKGTVPSGDRVTAYGRVRVPGLSDRDGGTPGLRAQFGVGTQGDNASTSAEWGWQEAHFNVDVPASGEDEYALTFQPAYNGTRAVSFRVTLNNGANWTYCDLNGSGTGGYEVGQQHALQVTDHQDFGFCNLQFPADAGTTSDAGVRVYGQLFSQGETPNPTLGVTAEVGTGNKVEDPGLAWTWSRAGFGSTTGNNNEYLLDLVRPPGITRYAFRFSRDGGSWCYGDLDGNGKNGAGNPWAGFSGDGQGGASNLGILTVVP